MIDAALHRRSALLADQATNAFRLFNSAGDGGEGLVVEQLGDVLVVQTHEGRCQFDDEELRSACEYVLKHRGCRAAYRKVFPKDRSSQLAVLEKLHNDPTPWIGAPVEPEVVIRESGLQFLVHPYDGYSTGIFLEHRSQRDRIRRLAAGKRVLNTFAYTCGFSVAAAAGGALETTSVDLAIKSLEWGKRNFAASGIALDAQKFIASDIFDYYRRANRQRRRFDVIILDPPTFSRTKRPARVFSIKEHLHELTRGALSLLDPDGIVLLCTNHRQTSAGALEWSLRDAARSTGRSTELIERPELPADFAGDPDFAKSILVRVS